MRITLAVLIGFVAVSALVTGLLMINYPDGSILGVPAYMIEASPFNNLVVPGIILSLGIGGINFLALYHFGDKNKEVYNWTSAAGTATCGWVAVQFALVHAVMWVQGVYLIIGISTILLSLQLRNKRLV